MAVRCDAAADRLLLTSGLFDYNADYTVCFWAYLVSDLNALGRFFAINTNSGGVDRDTLGVNTDGTTFRIYTSGPSTFSATGTNLSTATWYHMALVRTTGSQMLAYLNGVLNITCNGDSTTGRSTAATRLEFGAENSVNDRRVDARFHAIKIWTAEFTQAEIANEMQVIRPVRLENLYGFWPCFPGSGERARDYSGNGRNFTESGTLTDEDPPPVAYGARPWFAPFVAAAGGQPFRVRAQGIPTLRSDRPRPWN
jgi:hypothetical protein